jgi:hypothetical protein
MELVKESPDVLAYDLDVLFRLVFHPPQPKLGLRCERVDGRRCEQCGARPPRTVTGAPSTWRDARAARAPPERPPQRSVRSLPIGDVDHAVVELREHHGIVSISPVVMRATRESGLGLNSPGCLS